jgi:DNA-nicking Smr family endonuclease
VNYLSWVATTLTINITQKITNKMIHDSAVVSFRFKNLMEKTSQKLPSPSYFVETDLDRRGVGRHEARIHGG